jgi:hypothetical protein
VVAGEGDAGSGAVPQEVGGVIAEGGVADDGVEVGVAAAGQLLAAGDDDATGVELLAGVARIVPRRNNAIKAAPQKGNAWHCVGGLVARTLAV